MIKINPMITADDRAKRSCLRTSRTLLYMLALSIESKRIRSFDKG